VRSGLRLPGPAADNSSDERALEREDGTVSDQNDEFQADTEQQPGAGSFPTPRPTVRERSRRFFVRLPTEIDAGEGVGAEPAAEELAVDPDAVTQETASEGWSAAAGYGTADAAAAFGYPQESYEAQAEQPAAWVEYAQDTAPTYEEPAPAYEVDASGSLAVDPTQPDEAPSELPERPLAEQEYIPEAYDMQAYSADAAAAPATDGLPPAAPVPSEEPAWQPEPPPVEPAFDPNPLPEQLQPLAQSASEPFPEPSQFLGSTGQEPLAAEAPAWAEPVPTAAESEIPAEMGAAEAPFGAQAGWDEPARLEPEWQQPEHEAGVDGPQASPTWSFARPQPEPETEAPAPVAETASQPPLAEQPALEQAKLGQSVREPSPVEELAVQAPAPPAAEPEQPPAESGWTPPAKDWSTGPSWGGSRSAEKPKPAQAPSLLEDPVAAAGLYIPGDIERFEGDMPLFGDAEVMGPLWLGDGLGEPLFVDFNDLPQMLAGLRQLLPKGTRLTYNYDHERAWVRSLKEIDLAAYAESVRTLMWEHEGAGAPEQAAP
jgi:hypothetical protein